VPDFLDEAHPWAGEAMDGLEFPNGLSVAGNLTCEVIRLKGRQHEEMQH